MEWIRTLMFLRVPGMFALLLEQILSIKSDIPNQMHITFEKAPYDSFPFHTLDYAFSRFDGDTGIPSIFLSMFFVPKQD